MAPDRRTDGRAEERMDGHGQTYIPRRIRAGILMKLYINSHMLH